MDWRHWTGPAAFRDSFAPANQGYFDLPAHWQPQGSPASARKRDILPANNRLKSTRREPDLLQPLRLSHSDARAPRRRRSLSAQSHLSVHGSHVAALRTLAQTPIALSRTPVPTDTQAEFCQRHVYHQGRRRHQIPIALAAPSVPYFPRLRALALFGRRSVERADRLSLPASKNLHTRRH